MTTKLFELCHIYYTKNSNLGPKSHLSLLSLHPECNRITHTCPQVAHPTAPSRTVAITPTCCLPLLDTWTARRPATAARRTSAEEREPPHRRSPSAATASSSLEMTDDFCDRQTLVLCNHQTLQTFETLEVFSVRVDIVKGKTTCT